MTFWKKKQGDEGQVSGSSSSQAKVPVTQSNSDSEPSVVKGATPTGAKGAAPSAAVSNNPAQQAGAVSGARDSIPGADHWDTDKFGKVRSALGPGTVIQGKLSFDTPVRIDGKLSGEIFSTKALIVGAQGWIDAQITVAAFIVQGKVKGNITATEKVELFNGAQVEGDIVAPAIVIHEGAIFNGSMKMTGQTAAVAAEEGNRQPGAAKKDSPIVNPKSAVAVKTSSGSQAGASKDGRKKDSTEESRTATANPVAAQ